MILEHAILNVKKDQSETFEKDFKKAAFVINKMPGYIKHQLFKCIEVEDQYLLLVEWETLEDHTIGFRGSEEYQNWKSLLHHYYQPFPVVEHYAKIL